LKKYPFLKNLFQIGDSFVEVLFGIGNLIQYQNPQKFVHSIKSLGSTLT